jgi:predicted ArsR family transcriptional regulator
MTTARIGTAAGVSRDAVLVALRSSNQAMATDALAEAVGLSVNTVRFHLDRLCRDGLITRVTAPPDGPGRPRQVFRAVSPEAVDGAAAYRLLAGLLAEGLARTGGSQASLEAGRSWADRLVAAQDPSIGGTDSADANTGAVQRVVELFEDGGFAPELTDDGHAIALHRCPFRELAAVSPDVVCAVHLGFVRGALHRLQEGARAQGRIPHQIDADRVRLDPVLDGSGPCMVTLPWPAILSHHP